MAAWRNLGFAMVIFLAGPPDDPPKRSTRRRRWTAPGKWASFRHITLPLLRPTILFIVVITTIGYLQLFEEPFVMTDGGPLDRTLSISMYMYQQGFEFFHQGYAAADRVGPVPHRGRGGVHPVPRPPVGSVRRSGDDCPADISSPFPVAGPTAAAKPARLEGRAKRTNPLICVVLLIGLVLMVAPFLWMVLGSFKPQGEFLRMPPTWLPEQPTLDNYQRLFDRLDFPRFFFNSVVVAAAVTIGNLIFSPMLGWALAKLRWRGKGFVMGLVLATLMLPAGATLIPLFILMSSLGLVNTYPG